MDSSNSGATLRFGTSIERRLSEVASHVVARWQAEFEWWAHAWMACAHGVADAVADAIGHGEELVFAADDEQVADVIGIQLAREGQVSQEAYGAGRSLLGDAGLVEP